MSDEEIVAKLDLIQATLALAFSQQLDEARERLRSDEISASILDHADDWIGSPALQAVVAKEVGKSERSVRDRLTDLVTRRVLEARGTERQREFKWTGLV